MRGKSHPKPPQTFVSPVGQILTTAEAAELLKVSQRTVQDMIKSGKLGAYKVGRGYRVLDQHIQAFFAAQEVGTSQTSRA